MVKAEEEKFWKRWKTGTRKLGELWSPLNPENNDAAAKSFFTL